MGLREEEEEAEVFIGFIYIGCPVGLREEGEEEEVFIGFIYIGFPAGLRLCASRAEVARRSKAPSALG